MNVGKHKGVALVMVLLGLALLASAGSYLIIDDHLSIRRVENQRDHLQAQYLAQSGLEWAMLVLQKDGAASVTDHLTEPWNKLVEPIDIENGSLKIEVIDAQGKFNINNLRNDENGVWMAGFKRLLEMTDQDVGLADSVKDWIDKDTVPSGQGGAEDGDYLLLDPPMRAPNRFMGDISELLLIKGVDMAVYEAISPLISSVPKTGLKINVNTCPDSLFRILGRTVLPNSVETALASGRGENGYPSVEEFITATELASHGDVAMGLVGVASAYFLVNVTSSYGRITINNRYLLKRSIEEAVYLDIIRITGTS